jgi:hypothetical protein
MGRKIVKIVGLALLVACVGAGFAAAQDRSVPKSLVKFAEEKLAAMGADAQLVAFVEKDNQSPQQVDTLKDLDKKWQDKQIEGFIKTMLANPVSARLKKVIEGSSFIPEAFIMNAQGTIVGETNRTSTYWKGEAPKFTAAYNKGAGAIWYGKLEFDPSANANLVQISVPVVKGGKAIGAICFGVNVDEWEKR